MPAMKAPQLCNRSTKISRARPAPTVQSGKSGIKACPTYRYDEIETQIPQNHRLQLQLPETIPAGHAKIAVIYELPEATENKAVKMAAFLNALPDERDESGMSRETINEFLK